MKVFGHSGIFPLELDKTAKNQIYAFAVPLIMVFNCFFMREYLRAAADRRCLENTSGFSFDLYCPRCSPMHDLPCASGDTQLLYTLLGFAIYIFFGLAIMLPCLIQLRRRQVEETKLFE